MSFQDILLEVCTKFSSVESLMQKGLCLGEYYKAFGASEVADIYGCRMGRKKGSTVLKHGNHVASH